LPRIQKSSENRDSQAAWTSKPDGNTKLRSLSLSALVRKEQIKDAEVVDIAPAYSHRFENGRRWLKDELKMMPRPLAHPGVILSAGLALLAPFFLFDDRASAQTNFHADYVISFARITVGDVAVNGDISGAAYAISASGRIGGAARLLANGEAHLTTRGTTAGTRLTPTNFVFKINSPDDPLDVKMVIENGNVTEVTTSPPSGDGVPMSDADRRGILDPLSALLLPAVDAGDGLTKEVCQHTLPIFDGRHRYDLQLSFKRFDKITVSKGYAGPVVVCSVSYRPIAGHQESIPLVKYLAESREIEVAFAPVAGTGLLAPVRLVIANLLANLMIQAKRFDATTQAPTPSNSSPN